MAHLLVNSLPARLHTFNRGRYTLWADRVPAMFGRVNRFTLWFNDPREGWKRLVAHEPMSAVRAALSEGDG